MIYECFILELWCLHCIITLVLVLGKQEIKYRLVSKKQDHMMKKPQGNDKFLQKAMSSSFHWNKKHSSKQVVPITYTVEKRLFAVAIQ